MRRSPHGGSRRGGVVSAQERFADLWTDYLEGELDESGVAELRALLAAEASLLKLAADMYQTHRLLALVVEESPARQDEFVREVLSRLPEDADRFVSGVMANVERLASPAEPSREEVSPQPAASGRMRVAIVTTAVAVVVVLLIAVAPLILRDDNHAGSQQAGDSENSVPHRQQVVGNLDEQRDASGDVILTQAAGAELFGEFLPPVGESLEFGHEYALVAGLIEMRFQDGAKVILEAPSVFELTGRERLLLSAGNCSVHAPAGAEGFQVETPQTEITDLGTRFSVSVSEVGDTDVQVVEGLAEVVATRDQSAKPIRLSEREARRFNADVGSRPQSLKFKADEYRSELPDRVVTYEVSTTDGGYAWELQSVTVQRDGLMRKFPVDALTGVKVIHFRAGQNSANVTVPVGSNGDRLAGLESDLLLHTGVINPGGSQEPLRSDPVLSGSDSTPGMAVLFHKPVVNRPGPDVVFFELQSVTNPLEGDSFHVSPLKFDDGLRSLTIRRYDITLTSPEARLLPDIDLLYFSEPPVSRESLLTGTVERRLQTLRFRALAVGIDLSDLGYDDEATVEGLFFQDTLDDSDVVDPVFVAGLPTVE
jgi:ferric-dicitrate binding protein FerR (iron transport regulator)